MWNSFKKWALLIAAIILLLCSVVILILGVVLAINLFNLFTWPWDTKQMILAVTTLYVVISMTRDLSKTADWLIEQSGK